MGLKALQWVAHLPLTDVEGTPRAVLTILADRASDPGYAAFPSVKTMAATLGCSSRTVQRALSRLLDDELIRAGDPEAARKIRADKRPSVWDVLTPDLCSRESRWEVTTAPHSALA